MFSPGVVPGEIPENLLNRWIASLRTMILSSNDTERCSGLQALTLWAGLSKQMSFFPSFTLAESHKRRYAKEDRGKGDDLATS